MPDRALVTHGFGFGLGTRYIVSLGLGAAAPVPPRPIVRVTTFLPEVFAMSLFVTPPITRLDWAALVAASAPYTGAKMKLFVNDITPDENTTSADLTEADFGGYSDATVTWDTPYIDGAGNVHLPADNVVFLCTGSPFNTIYGYWLETSGGDYLGGARFDDAPRPIPAAGYGIDASVEVII